MQKQHIHVYQIDTYTEECWTLNAHTCKLVCNYHSNGGYHWLHLYCPAHSLVEITQSVA